MVLQPRVVTREMRELSFDSRIIADNAWGNNNGAARHTSTRGAAYDMIGNPKSNTAVKERKAVVSVPRKQRVTKAAVVEDNERKQSGSGGKVRASTAGGRVTVAADKSRIAALLHLGKGREVGNGSDAADGKQ